MASSETDIANMALMSLGIKKPIDNLLTDESNEARYCKRFYAPSRDAMLRSHPWNCAIHRKTITPLAATPDSDWDYQYQLPANPHCLRVLQVGEAVDQPIEWVVEERKLLCNESTIKLVYIKRITDTNEFDPLLVEAISLKMAIKMSMPLAGKSDIKDSLIKELELITLPLARTIDGQEGSTESLIIETWERSRY